MVDKPCVKEFLEVCKEYYSITPPENIAEEILSVNPLLVKEMKFGVDTSVREEIGQSLVNYILIYRNIEMKKPDEFSPSEDWHFPYNGSDEDYNFQFWTTFLFNAESLGFKVKLPKEKYTPKRY